MSTRTLSDAEKTSIEEAALVATDEGAYGLADAMRTAVETGEMDEGDLDAFRDIGARFDED